MRQLSVLLFLLCMCRVAGAVDTRPPRPVAVISGADSHVRTGRYELVTEAETWRKVWLEHQGKTAQEAFEQLRPTFDVDFDKYVVVAIFQGTGINTRALTVERLVEDDQRVVMRFDQWTYQTDSGADESSAYALVLLPKTDKPIVLEENTQGIKDRPPRWTERVRLTALRSRFDVPRVVRRPAAPPPPVLPPAGR